MKQRQTERERIEQQQAKLPKQTDDSGLRVSKDDVFFDFISFFILVANELTFKELFCAISSYGNCFSFLFGTIIFFSDNNIIRTRE
jgi:hypothetical protein